jgi:hypothetical protein
MSLSIFLAITYLVNCANSDALDRHPGEGRDPSHLQAWEAFSFSVQYGLRAYAQTSGYPGFTDIQDYRHGHLSCFLGHVVLRGASKYRFDA